MFDFKTSLIFRAIYDQYYQQTVATTPPHLPACVPVTHSHLVVIVRMSKNVKDFQSIFNGKI